MLSWWRRETERLACHCAIKHTHEILFIVFFGILRAIVDKLAMQPTCSTDENYCIKREI